MNPIIWPRRFRFGTEKLWIVVLTVLAIVAVLVLALAGGADGGQFAEGWRWLAAFMEGWRW